METPSSPAAEASRETVLWSGSPDPQGVRASALARVRAFRLATCGVALVAMFVGVQMDPANWGGNAQVPVLIAAAGGIAAAAATLWPHVLAFRARRTSYAITDRGLVIEERLFGRRSRHFGAERMVPLHIVQGDDDHGDVCFAVCTCRVAAGLSGLFGRRAERPVGFLSVPDPERVARLITETFGVPRSTRLN